MKKKISLFLLLSLALLFGCQKEVLTENSEPTLSGDVSSHDYSTNGWDMHVDMDGHGGAVITSDVSSRPAASGDEFVILGPGAERLDVEGPSFQRTSANGDDIDFQEILMPAGQTYWAVPFNGRSQPVRIDGDVQARPIIGISSCLCTGSPSPACYPTGGLGCQTFVCNWCGRIIVIINRALNTTVFQGDAEPVVVIQADRLVRNGVAYQ
ncbi:MAG: hypothetical protein U0176_19510 [Bacteroidia bacterium]